jgi:ATP-dependent DNA helicase RecG
MASLELTADIVDRTLRTGEDSRNEFKSVEREMPRAERVAREIVAFANSGGGRIWFGVEDDGRASGVGDRARADALLTLVDEACAHNVVPSIACRHEKWEHAGKLLVVTSIPGYAPDRPYRANDGIHYLRGGATSRTATASEVKRLVQSAASSVLVPDELPVLGTDLGDLDLDQVRSWYGMAFGENPPTERAALRRQLELLKILTPDGLSLLGVLGFAREPQRFLPWARVSAARSPGTEVGLEYTDRQEFGGTLRAQIAATEDFLLRHLQSPATIEGFAPESPRRAPQLPLEALREVVRNAVVHRDYSVRSQVIVTVYDDRVEVLSPGQLLNSVTIESIRLGVHVERNPRLATHLARLGMMTERGSGVPRVIKLMRDHGLPEPRIEERGPSLLVTLRSKPLAP